MTMQPEVIAIVAYITIILISLAYILVRQEAIKEKNIEKAKEKEQKALMAEEEKKRIESKTHLEIRIGNFLKTHEGILFTEKELKAKIALNTQDASDFHRTLIAVTYYQQRLGFNIAADSKTGSKNLCYYFKTPNK